MAILGHTMWVEQFGRSQDVVGQTLGIGNQLHEIIGVLPRDFRGDTRVEMMVWTPEVGAGGFMADDFPVEGALAKLAPGISLEAAQAELDAIIQNNPLAQRANLQWVSEAKTPNRSSIPPSNGPSSSFRFLRPGPPHRVRESGQPCSRPGETRAKEFALRASLGAGRGRLIRQLLC